MPGAGEFGYEQTFFSENLRPIPADTLLKISQVNFDTTFAKNRSPVVGTTFVKNRSPFLKGRDFFIGYSF